MNTINKCCCCDEEIIIASMFVKNLKQICFPCMKWISYKTENLFPIKIL